MPNAPDNQGPRGRTYTGPRYLDAMRLLMARDSTSTGSPTMADVAAADLNNPYEEIRALSGIVEMGPADGVLILPMGGNDDDDAYGIFVSRYDPVLNASGQIAGWIQTPIKFLTVVLNSSITAGATMASLISGVLATDLMADAITQDDAGANQIGLADLAGGNGLDYANNGATATGRNHAIVSAWSAPFLRFQVNLNTGAGADDAVIVGRRVSGFFSHPAKGGGA